MLEERIMEERESAIKVKVVRGDHEAPARNTYMPGMHDTLESATLDAAQLAKTD
jgi:hypothetical protein